MTSIELRCEDHARAIQKRKKKADAEKLLKSNVIYLNNENTKYEVIPLVCDTLGWKTCKDLRNTKLDWDIYWTGGHIQHLQYVTSLTGMNPLVRSSFSAHSMRIRDWHRIMVH